MKREPTKVDVVQPTTDADGFVYIQLFDLQFLPMPIWICPTCDRVRERGHAHDCPLRKQT